MNLGVIYAQEGECNKAKSFFEKALEIRTKHFGKGHFETSYSMMNLGNYYINLGDLNNAKKLIEEALEIQINHYGEGHLETANTL